MAPPDDRRTGTSDEALAERLAALSPEARALLKRRLADRRSGDGEQAPRGDSDDRVIPQRDPAEPVQLSFAQWRLWFLEQLRPGTNAWNTPVAVTLRGPLDVDALQRALQLLVERHSTLRTLIRTAAGQPVPDTLEDARIELPVVDISTSQGEVLARSIGEFVGEEVARPFRIDSELLLRARLLRTAPQEHVFVLVAHHIACDGWSKGLLLEELGTAYDALCAGTEPELPELPIEYADFATWQRRHLTGPTLDRLTAYWQECLTGAPTALELPTDHPRPPRQAFVGAVEWLEVPAPLVDGAIAIGREERATPFMTMMAAFTVLLHAYSGAEELLIGSPAAMRTHPELERIIGMFANTLVYRTSLAGGPSFRQVIRRVRETAVGVYAHQDLPFEKIVEAVRPPRDVSRSPLVQVNMRIEGREPELRLEGIGTQAIPVDPGIARFDLAIELGTTDNGLAGYLEYDAALFDQPTAVRYARDFLALLEGCTMAPDHRLGLLEAFAAIRDRGRVEDRA